MGFCSAPPWRRLPRPREPVDRIMRMLPQVGRFFPGEPVGETGRRALDIIPRLCYCKNAKVLAPAGIPGPWCAADSKRFLGGA